MDVSGMTAIKFAGGSNTRPTGTARSPQNISKLQRLLFMSASHFKFPICLIFLGGSIFAESRASDFEQFLKPLLVQKCVKCHGETNAKGEVNLKQIMNSAELLKQPELIERMLDVIDSNSMPPEDEPQLDEQTRARLLAELKNMLLESVSGKEVKDLRLRRLNRFQYNNSVKDLFQLRIDAFSLPEKLMTRHENYLSSNAEKMPDSVRVASHSLAPEAGMRDVNAFPKDLRASHGFDNQANQLTLSPLLLDAFLRLSVSIVESPDFTDQNVGIWNDFFKEPTASDALPDAVRKRLDHFLTIAFRGPVDEETLQRYTAYTLAKIQQGLSFTDAMKKVASAALSSPMFLYRSRAFDGRETEFELASNLSFFLWASCPDAELLRLAESGELSQPDTLGRTVTRMLADPKIERFLDTFPSQWMQLENVLAATPDPRKNRLFSLDKNNPASLQMVLEPLLLFDAVFVEDRPIVELISPTFSYQSEFLNTWYTSDLKPQKVNEAAIVEENRLNDERRRTLNTTVESVKEELDALITPVKAQLLAARKADAGAKEPVDLKPYAAWEFDGDLAESIHSLRLTAHGEIQYKDGMVMLNKSYLQSETLPIELKAKTLEVWCSISDLNQRGGGVMGIQGPGDFFDTIVLGERKPQHWISGSNGFSRTEDFPDSVPENSTDELLHLAMVYSDDGTTTLYRNGSPYGKPFRKGAATFPKDNTSVIFGLRHLPAGGNKYLTVNLDRARLYDRALSADEVASSASGDNLYISNEELLQALTPVQRKKHKELNASLEQAAIALKNVPAAQDPDQLRKNAQKALDDSIRSMMRSRSFERVAASDTRYGGIITNAAMLSMTSGPKRTHPIARGAWVIEVIFNDPPPPPPNDVPALDEDQGSADLTIREKFAQHRENPDCAGCHSRLDPLGFALENFDITGRWRNKYENGRDVDSSGTLLKKYDFDSIVRFKESLVKENRRFATAFTRHLLRFALSRELSPVDSLAVDSIVNNTQDEGFRLQSLIREIVLSDSFRRSHGVDRP
jgi:hypothetical protein